MGYVQAGGIWHTRKYLHESSALIFFFFLIVTNWYQMPAFQADSQADLRPLDSKSLCHLEYHLILFASLLLLLFSMCTTDL